MAKEQLETRARSAGREAIARIKDEEGAPNTAAAIRSGAWDAQYEVRYATAGAAVALATEATAAGMGEVAALREALTPSAETKAAYHGEFQFNIEYADEDGNSYWSPHLVPWDQVKEIMAAITVRAALSQESPK